jgi:SprT protein
VCAGRARRHRVTGEEHIELNAELLVPGREKERNDTFLHEVAHLIAGIKAQHGLAWKRAAMRLGAKPVTCHNLPFLVAKAQPKRAVARCTRCGHTWFQARVVKRWRWETRIHRRCGGRLEAV